MFSLKLHKKCGINVATFTVLFCYKQCWPCHTAPTVANPLTRSSRSAVACFAFHLHFICISYVCLQPARLSGRYCTSCHWHWVRFSDQSWSYCTLLTCCSSCDDINCIRTHMLMIRNSTGHVVCRSLRASASTTYGSEWCLTGCSSILSWHKSFSAHLLDINSILPLL